MADISNSTSVIDVRDIIARVEELEQERDEYVIGAPDGTEAPDPAGWARDNAEDAQELAQLAALLGDLAGYGGDEQWRGDWYPGTLIRDSYFQDYAQELAEDLHGDAIRASSWPFNCIDWERAGDELRADYSSVEYDGTTYLYR